MKNIYKKINRTKYSLGELISIVGSCARNSKEMLAAMTDLLDSGRVVIRKSDAPAVSGFNTRGDFPQCPGGCRRALKSGTSPGRVEADGVDTFCVLLPV
ncbi:MAG: hypothetical protein ACKOF3_10255 [Spartobacteria bacterium]